MLPFVAFVTRILSILTVIADLAVIFIVAVILFKKYSPSPFFDKAFHFLSSNALRLGFVTVLGSVLGSLFYSEIAGFPPCSLCWLQRIFMYPQIIFFGVLFFKKTKVLNYIILIFSIIGGIVALYNSYLQFGGSPFIPCNAVISSVSCSQRFFLEFGYITIPTMSLTAFLLITVLIIGNISNSKKNL